MNINYVDCHSVLLLSVIVRNAYFGPGEVSCMSSFYSSELTTDHPQYDRAWMNGVPLHYYEPIEIKSSVTQNVFIKSNSTKDLYGYLYRSSFSTLSPSTNQLASNDDDAGNQQFKINYALTNGTSYILVVTTFYENVVAPFTIEIIHSYNDSIQFSRTINITISNVFSSSEFVRKFLYHHSFQTMNVFFSERDSLSIRIDVPK